MEKKFTESVAAELEQFRKDGIYKTFNHLESPQSARVKMRGRGEVIVLSSNNYLGLCDVPEVIAAGKQALDTYGAGTGSVRFICGTFAVHEDLEKALAAFVGTEAAATYVSCWTANTGLMATFFDEQDLVVSDELNHASIIDGIRICKAPRKVYKHSDMKDLETVLKEGSKARRRFVITDGIFSMEGDICRLPDLVEICRRHDAILAVDDSHATGVLGKTGRGTAEHYNLVGQVDIITSTLGKALGGAAGGFTAAARPVVEYLEQRSRPLLFSNALPPTVAASALASVRFLQEHPERVTRLHENARYFRGRLKELGFKPLDGDTPIIPVIVGETSAAIRMSQELLAEGIFVTGFGFPVVPDGKARIRCQISAAHSRADLDAVLAALAKVGKRMKLI